MGTSGWGAGYRLCLRLIGGGLLLWLGSAGLAQTGFNMEEKRLVEVFKKANPHYLKGRAAFNRGKYDKAQDHLQECLEIMPQFADAHFYLARIAYAQNDLDAALREILAAEEDFRFIRGFRALTHQQMLDRIGEQRSLLDDTMQQWQAQKELARSADEKQRIEVILSQLRSSLNVLDNQLERPLPDVIEEPADYPYYHGNILFRRRDFDGARTCFERAVAIDPRLADAWNNLANVFYVRRDYPQAMACLEKAELNGARVNENFRAALKKALDR